MLLRPVTYSFTNPSSCYGHFIKLPFYSFLHYIPFSATMQVTICGKRIMASAGDLVTVVVAEMLLTLFFLLIILCNMFKMAREEA